MKGGKLPQQPIFLKVYQAGKLIKSQQFMVEQISIGSGAEGPLLVLEDPSVNYWHALIEKRGNEYYISDLGSPTGTFVNSHPVLESPVKHGDHITVGELTIHFYVGVPFAKPAASPSAVKPPPPPSQQAPSTSQQAPSPSAVKPPPPPSQQAPSTSQQAPSPSAVKPPPPPSQKTPAPPSSPPPPQAPSPQKKPSVKKAKSSPSPDFHIRDDVRVKALEQTEIIPSPPAQHQFSDKAPAAKSSPKPPVARPDSRAAKSAAAPEKKSIPSTTPPAWVPKQTYAPKSAVAELDHQLHLGGGPVLEVLIAWKERILCAEHFYRTSTKKSITFGSDLNCDISIPNLLGIKSYKLLDMKDKATVYIADQVPVKMRDNEGEHLLPSLEKAGLVAQDGHHRLLTIFPGQLVRLDFSSTIRVYIRYTNKSRKAHLAPVFDFSTSETMAIMMSGIFIFGLIFYIALSSMNILNPDEDLETAKIKKATIEFKRPRRPVRLKLAKRKKKTKLSIPIKKIKKKKRKRKVVGIKKAGKKRGRLGRVAAKPKVKTKRKAVTSARPGGSVKTGKRGGSPKSPRPDPTKVGLLGVFGSRGTQKALDQAYSGAGELAGLSETATGHAGQKEAYSGEGIGTKFKNAGAGGKGNNLIGVSGGIKTRGRGGGVKGYGTGGSLGARGNVQLALGVDDWEVEGGVDKDAIHRVIERNKYQLEWCYESVLQKKTDLEGKVLFQWEIVNEKVRKIKIKQNTTRNRVLARCLMSRLKNFRFSGTGLQPGQIGVVTIPFAVTKK